MLKIFLSSTFRDLKDTRSVILKKLDSVFKGVGMEEFIPDGSNSQEVCIGNLKKMEIIIPKLIAIPIVIKIILFEPLSWPFLSLLLERKNILSNNSETNHIEQIIIKVIILYNVYALLVAASI